MLNYTSRHEHPKRGEGGWMRLQFHSVCISAYVSFHSTIVSSYPVLPGFETWCLSRSPIIVRNTQHQLKFLQKCFPNSFARGPRLVSKNNHGSSHPWSRKYRVSRWQVSKIKHLYLITKFRQLRILTSSTTNNALRDLTLTTVARLVGTGGF